MAKDEYFSQLRKMETISLCEECGRKARIV